MKKRLPLLGLSLLLFGTINYAQTFTPIPVAGFDQDVVAETSPAQSSTSGVLDGSDYVLYTVDYGNTFSTGTGLPNNGTITNGGSTYQLQPYNQPNGMVLSTGQTDSLELVTPGHFSSVSLLGFSTEGPGTLLVVLLFTDGSGTVNSNLPLPDWFSGTNAVLSGFDRTGRTSDTPDFLSDQPNMYRVDIPLSCADQAKLLEEMLIINITPSPIIRTCIFAASGSALVSATATGTDITCNGLTDGTATATGANGQPGYTYSWNSTPPQTTATATGLEAGEYVVTVTDDSGCIAMDTVSIAEPASIGSNQSFTLCQGESVTVGGNTYSTDGTYSDVFTAANGCDSTVVTVVSVTPVNVAVSTTGFTMTASGAGLQYRWLDCGNGFSAISGATGQSYTATVNGSYAVEVTQNGCTDTSACVNISTFALAENGPAALALEAYPNPAQDYVLLQTGHSIRTVELFDVTGKKQPAAFQTSKLDLTGLAPGVYWVRVTADTGENTTLKIVKQ